MTLKSIIYTAAPMVAASLMVGLAFYYLGNQPVFKQAAVGLNGGVSPSAPAAVF